MPRCKSHTTTLNYINLLVLCIVQQQNSHFVDQSGAQQHSRTVSSELLLTSPSTSSTPHHTPTVTIPPPPSPSPPPLLPTAPADMDTYVYDHRGLKVRKSSLSSSSSPVSPVHTRSLSSNTATTTTGRLDTPPSVACIITLYHSPICL